MRPARVPTVGSGLLDYLDVAGVGLPWLERIVVGGAPPAQGRATSECVNTDELGYD